MHRLEILGQYNCEIMSSALVQIFIVPIQLGVNKSFHISNWITNSIFNAEVACRSSYFWRNSRTFWKYLECMLTIPGSMELIKFLKLNQVKHCLISTQLFGNAPVIKDPVKFKDWNVYSWVAYPTYFGNLLANFLQKVTKERNILENGTNLTISE